MNVIERSQPMGVKLKTWERKSRSSINWQGG